MDKDQTCRWKAAKFRPMLGAQGLWAGRDLYRVTPAVTRGLSFSGLIQRTAPFSRLLRHARGCWGPILTRILTERKDMTCDYDAFCKTVPWQSASSPRYKTCDIRFPTFCKVEPCIIPRGWPPTSPKVHQSEGPIVRRSTSPKAH
jgi:hypothetical protein